MKLSDKIIGLRKTAGMSQEDLAEKLSVSRQTISRWESGAAMPDANNILQLSKLFGVTTDYLLNDNYESDADVSAVYTIRERIIQRTIAGIFISCVGLVLSMFSFIYAVMNPWVVNDIGGLLGSFLGTRMLIPFLIGIVVIIAGLVICFKGMPKRWDRKYISLRRKK